MDPTPSARIAVGDGTQIRLSRGDRPASRRPEKGSGSDRLPTGRNREFQLACSDREELATRLRSAQRRHCGS